MYNGLAKICQMFLDIAKKKKKKLKKFRQSNIRTFKMSKILKNKKENTCLNVQWACKYLPNVFRYCKEKKKKKLKNVDIQTFEHLKCQKY